MLENDEVEDLERNASERRELARRLRRQAGRYDKIIDLLRENCLDDQPPTHESVEKDLKLIEKLAGVAASDRVFAQIFDQNATRLESSDHAAD